MFITKRRLEELLMAEREKAFEGMRREREMTGFYNDMRELERRLDARIDRLAERVLPKEERENRCPFEPVK